MVVDDPRRGCGRACLRGLSETETPGVVVFTDADYSVPEQLPELVEPIAENRVGFVLGSRFLGQRASLCAATAKPLWQPVGLLSDDRMAWRYLRRSGAISTPVQAFRRDGVE